MIQLIRVTDPNHNYWDRLMTLYGEAFPVEERRNLGQLRKMIQATPQMYFNAIVSDGELGGFFVYWNMDDFYYLEYLAVFSSMRNKKIGQQVLDYVAEHLDGIRLLEVEPEENEMTIRRIRYYERNGYKILNKDYVQPSYDGIHDACPLWIMGNKKTEHLPEFINRIKHEVYLDNYALIEK